MSRRAASIYVTLFIVAVNAFFVIAHMGFWAGIVPASLAGTGIFYLRDEAVYFAERRKWGRSDA